MGVGRSVGCLIEQQAFIIIYQHAHVLMYFILNPIENKTCLQNILPLFNDFAMSRQCEKVMMGGGGGG